MRAAIAHAVAPLALIGCGRVAFDPLGTPPDAACTLQAFGTPTRVDELSTTAGEVTPSLSKDGLVLAFASTRAGGAGANDLYIAQRATTDAAFESVRNIAELNAAEDDYGVALSADALTMYFAHGSPGELFFASRADRAATFGAAAMIAGATTEYDDLSGAEISTTGLELMFTAMATQPPVGRRIYMMSRPDVTSPFGPVRRLDELDPMPAGFPTLSPDGLELLFTSNGEIWRATRPAIGARFEAPQLVPELSSPQSDDDAELVGQRTVFFKTARLGDDDIFTATRDCL